MARKFWTLLPQTYYTYKQLAQGGRNEVYFTAVGNCSPTQPVLHLTF